MVGDHLLHIGQSPATSGQVDREQLSLATATPSRASNPPASRNAARRTLTAPQAMNPRTDGPGQVGRRRQGAVGHLLAHRVEPLVRADQDPCRQHRQPGMAVQQLDGSAQGARRPPGVVVAEGDIGAVDQAGPDGAGRPARLPRSPITLDARVMGADQFGRAVGGAVVDHHDRRLLVEGAQPCQRAEQLGWRLRGGD